MKHRYAGSRLGRNSSWRKATVRDVAKATLVSQRICTTKAKAQEARKLVERLITMGKKGTLAHRRQAFAVLCDHQLVSDLFTRTAPRFKHRNGGYTRVISLSNRRGDNAQLVFLELTEKEEVIISKAKSSAVAKPKPIDVTPHPESTAVKDVSKTAPEESKKISPKPEQEKSFFKKVLPRPEKNTGVKNFFGGLRKIFKSRRAE
jgi:large subunit ribosomal protein L17